VINPALKNISEFPTSIQPVITEFANKLLETFSDNVLSVLVYGSAAGINYNPGVSNINMAVIVKDLNFSLLKQSVDLVKWGHKHKMATPLFLTKEYILNALDVFPVEFSEIKEQHKLIFGDDIFSALGIPRQDVRLLCEQQVKGKLLRLRQAYLEIGSNNSGLKNILIAALNDLMPIFRQLLILKGQQVPEHKEEMLTLMSKTFALDAEPFLAVYQDKNKKVTISSKLIEVHLQNFLNQLEILSRHLDLV